MLLSIHYADRVYLLCHLVLLIKNKNVRPVHEAGFRFKQRTLESTRVQLVLNTTIFLQGV